MMEDSNNLSRESQKTLPLNNLELVGQNIKSNLPFFSKKAIIFLIVILGFAIIYIGVFSPFRFFNKAALKECDFTKYSTVGCESGYKCFIGTDSACGPDDDCSAVKNVGDNLCHKLCSSDSDCPNKLKCKHKVSFAGNIKVVNDAICVEK